MNKKITFLTILFILPAIYLNAQSGPGGIGNTSGTSSLQLWLSADSANVNTNLVLVDTLFDMSGAGNHVYSTGSNRPSLITGALNGQPVLQFTGSQFMEASGVNASFGGTEATFFAVYTTYGSPSNGNAIIAAAPASWNNYFLLEKEYTYHIHNIPSAGHFAGRGHHCPMPDSGKYVVHGGAIGTTAFDLNTFMNNVKSTEAPYSVGSPGSYTAQNRRIHIGYRQDWSSWLYGNVAEIIGYNVKLSDSAIAEVSKYLMNKYDIKQGGLLSVTDSIEHVTCNGLSNGSIELFPQAGTSPYTYQWSNGNSIQLNDSLVAGTYTVTVADQSGCAVAASYVITEPAALSAVVTFTNSSCQSCCDGQASAAVSGGTAAYTYSWSPGGQTNATATNLCPGLYTVSVTDANGCATSSTVTVSGTTGLTLNPALEAFSIYPNPSGGTFWISGAGYSKIEVMSVIGERILTMQGHTQSATIDLSAFPGGIYFVNIHTERGVVTRRVLIEK